MLTRFAMELIIDIAEQNNIDSLQSKVLGYLIRKRVSQKKSFYKMRESEIIIIQKNIRRYQLQNAYKVLMSTGSPKLSTVRKFVHILNQSDNELFSANLQKLKANINDVNDEVGELQESLRKKVLMKDSLEKRRIDVCKFLTPAGRQQLEIQFNAISSDNISANLKSLYGKAGFLLQVDSFYWHLLAKGDPRFCVTNLPKLFAPIRGAIGDRENSLLIKVIGDLLVEEIDESSTLNDFLVNDDAVWIQVLQNYLTSFRSKEILTAFAQLYKYLDSNAIDFESDPSKIYAKLHPTAPPQLAHEAIEDLSLIHILYKVS